MHHGQLFYLTKLLLFYRVIHQNNMTLLLVIRTVAPQMGLRWPLSLLNTLSALHHKYAAVAHVLLHAVGRDGAYDQPAFNAFICAYSIPLRVVHLKRVQLRDFSSQKGCLRAHLPHHHLRRARQIALFGQTIFLPLAACLVDHDIVPRWQWSSRHISTAPPRFRSSHGHFGWCAH